MQFYCDRIMRWEFGAILDSSGIEVTVGWLVFGLAWGTA